MNSIEISSAPQAQPSPPSRLTIPRIILLCFLFIYDAMVTTYMDSFLSDMLVEFELPALSKIKTIRFETIRFDTKVVYGYLLGRLVSASLWGILMDKHGRKNVLLAVLLIVPLMTMFLAFTTEYYDCLSLRIIIGFFNGIPVIGKTLCTEICSTEFKSWSVSLVNASWALGLIVGPVFGLHILQKYPVLHYAAPSLAIAIIGGFLAVLSLFIFEETLKPEHQYQQIQSGNNRIVNSIGELDARNEYIHLSKVLRIHNTAKLSLIFTFTTLVASGFDQLVFHWMGKKYDKGGLAFNYETIYKAYQSLTAIQIILQAVLYPNLQRKYGDYWILRQGHKLLILAVVSIPYTRLFFSQEYPVMLITWVIIWMLVRQAASFMVFCAIQRFTNEIVSGNKRGKLNGCQVGFATSLLFAQSLGAQIMDWSMSHRNIFPFNYYFVFLLTCGMTAWSLSVVYTLKFIDRNRRRLRGERNRVG